jgi:hypothetical protein
MSIIIYIRYDLIISITRCDLFTSLHDTLIEEGGHVNMYLIYLYSISLYIKNMNHMPMNANTANKKLYMLDLYARYYQEYIIKHDALYITINITNMTAY